MKDDRSKKERREAREEKEKKVHFRSECMNTKFVAALDHHSTYKQQHELRLK